MADTQIFSNNAISLLASPLGIGDSVIQLLSGHGGMFPSPGPDEFFLVTLEDQASSVREIVRISERVGDTLIVAARGQEDTIARNWSASAGNDTLVDHRITAGTLQRLSNEYNNPGFNSLSNFSEAIDYLLSGSPTTGQESYDVEFEIAEPLNQTTKITLPISYKPGSIRLFIGGARQKKNADFIETGANEITLQFALTNADILEGQNVVIDCTVA